MIGIVGGSGLYSMPGFEAQEEIAVETPFGSPSDSYVVGMLSGKRVAFLARHGIGHRLTPSELNFRANVFGFKTLGVEYILSASAVGSLKEEYKPLDLVIPDQFLDRTRGRISTFSIRACSFVDGGGMALRQVAGSGFDVVEQAAARLEFNAVAMRHLPQQARPSDVVVPGLLDGLTSVNRLAGRCIAAAPQPRVVASQQGL